MISRFKLSLFAWGIVGCAISRWRINGIGPGEFLIALAVLLTFLQAGFWVPPSAVRRVWVQFWVMAGVALLGGTCWAGVLGVWQPAEFIHDAQAFLFCFIGLIALLGAISAADQRAYFVRQFLRAGIFLTLLNLTFYGFFSLYLHEAGHWISRFNGLANNPNQLALYSCLLPFWLLQRPYVLGKKERVLGVVGSLGLGLLTGSDALLLAWLAGGCWLIGWSWRGYWVSWFPGKSGAVLGFLLLLAGAAALNLLWAPATAVYAIGGQGDLRLLRWQNGMAAFAHSPVFGLGPGTFSGNEGAFEGQEAHNLYIDWLASGGLLAGFALLGLQFRVWLTLHTGGARVLLAGFISLLVFSSFHYVARHPIFWLTHLLFLLNPPTPCAVSLAR